MVYTRTIVCAHQYDVSITFVCVQKAIALYARVVVAALRNFYHRADGN